MTHYTATLRHHSISHTYTIDCGTDFGQAQRKAEAEFDDGFRGHEIVIYGQRDGCAPEVYATRVIGDRDGWMYR